MTLNLPQLIQLAEKARTDYEAGWEFVAALWHEFPALVARLQAAEALLDRLFAEGQLVPDDATLYESWRQLRGDE